MPRELLQKPTMLYDGDCSFCLYWVRRCYGITGNLIGYEPYQKVIAGYPEVTKKQCKQAVQLIMPDGSFFSGAYAVFKAAAFNKRYVLFLWLYENVSLFRWVSEWFYQSISRHRRILSKFYYRYK